MDTSNPDNELLNAISQIVKDEVSELRNEMNARFDEVDTKLGEVDKQLGEIKYDLKEAFKDIAIVQDRMEEHVAMYHVRGTVMQAMQQK